MTEWKPINGGTHYLARTIARGRGADGMAAAFKAAALLFADAPPDTYPWRVEVQKSAAGARLTVTVTVGVRRDERG